MTDERPDMAKELCPPDEIWVDAELVDPIEEMSPDDAYMVAALRAAGRPVPAPGNPFDLIRAYCDLAEERWTHHDFRR